MVSYFSFVGIHEQEGDSDSCRHQWSSESFHRWPSRFWRARCTRGGSGRGVSGIVREAVRCEPRCNGLEILVRTNTHTYRSVRALVHRDLHTRTTAAVRVRPASIPATVESTTFQHGETLGLRPTHGASGISRSCLDSSCMHWQGACWMRQTSPIMDCRLDSVGGGGDESRRRSTVPAGHGVMVGDLLVRERTRPHESAFRPGWTDQLCSPPCNPKP